MRSPFPGMDPYLEAPSLWPDFHTRLITIAGELLTPQVAPNYFVRVERRVYLLGEDDAAIRQIIPDVILHESGAPKTPRGTLPPGKLGPTPVVTLIEAIEVRETRLSIHSVAGDRPVVTAIELLSPTNKTLGSHGREEYLSKRRDVLHSSAHMVEIDLLREGAPVPLAVTWPEGDYRVHISRAERRPRGEVYVWRVREELPEIPIPLRKNDPDAVLDLGKAVRTAYERARYDLEIDYKTSPDPPLAPVDSTWAADIIAKRTSETTS